MLSDNIVFFFKQFEVNRERQLSFRSDFFLYFFVCLRQVMNFRFFKGRVGMDKESWRWEYYGRESGVLRFGVQVVGRERGFGEEEEVVLGGEGVRGLGGKNGGQVGWFWTGSQMESFRKRGDGLEMCGYFGLFQLKVVLVLLYWFFQITVFSIRFFG